MPIPSNFPNRSEVDLALARLEDAAPPLEARLRDLEGDRRQRTALWLIVAEAQALRRGLADLKGLRMLAFGVSGGGPGPWWSVLRRRPGGRDRSLAITAFADPGAHWPEGALEPILVEDEDGFAHFIPVRWQPWELTRHASLNLLDATLCCWVKPNSGGSGIVTARHAAFEDTVSLDDGSYEPVLWYAPGGLDALVANGPSGRTLSSLSAQPPLAEDPVEVMTKTGAQAREVIDVSQTWGTTTSAIPHNFLLDRPLNEGDSGSLVRLRENGEGLGLYIGKLETDEGPRGLCQGLSQLDSLFRFEGQSEGFYAE